MLARHAFTYIEMLFVLSIIAIILYMQMKFLHDTHSVYTRDNQIQQLILKFYYFKSKAIKENQSIT
ncbi:type II secretion system protein, partial [Staphylococcus arlettae]